MTCKDIEEKLTAYQEGTLPPEEKRLVEEHLVECAQCSTNLAELEKTVGLLKNLPEVEPPPWFAQKIITHIRKSSEEKSSILKRLFYPFHIKIPLEVFATLCVVALGLYVYKISVPETKIYQTPPTAIIEVPAKDATVDKLKDEPKPIEPSQAKPDKGALLRKEQVPKPSFRDEAQRAPSEAMGEQKEEAPVAIGVAPPASAPFIGREKDVNGSADSERKEEPAKKAFQRAPLPGKADVQSHAEVVVTLSVENLASASMEVEKVFRTVGIAIIKRESQDGIQTFIVHCPAQKLQWLLDRLRAIGDLGDSHTTAGTLNGDLRITIRVEQR